MIRLFQISLFPLLILPFRLTGQETNDVFTSSSVLASGKWFKIALTMDGVYRIDYQDLQQLGLENPSYPRLFGNNTGQLSYFNDGSAPDDLKEIAIFTSTGNDKIFNEGDYLLFYGKATHRWIFDEPSGDYQYRRHNYSDTAFYFLTSGAMQGKRILPATPISTQPDFYSSVSDALHIHEIESDNLIKSGREWYQPMTYIRDFEINPGFRNIVTSEISKYSLRVLARSSAPALFRLYNDGSLLDDISVPEVNLTSTTGTYARDVKVSGQFLPLTSSPSFTLKFVSNGQTSALAWLDYLIIHARKNNTFDGQYTSYTDSKSVGPGSVTEFTIKNTYEGVTIWDVSDPYNTKIIEYSESGGNIKFRSSSDMLRTYVAFTPENTISPVIRSHALPNQDLHSSEPVAMVIVAHPKFISYASEIAGFHYKESGLTSLVVTPEQIFNEFSGGIPDIAAIRNFLRMKFLKQKGSDLPLKYLLLFGDGSYDNKSAPPGNPNYIPTWQSKNSTIFISSFASDDFYGLLEDGEGEETGTEDIGIGRLPVSDTIQAGIIVSKIKGYLDPANTGDWKNNICLIADDEDGNTHISDAEGLADLMTDSVPWVNINKIYFDAYNQVTTSTGQFYPDVEKAINDNINSGTLIFNYIGHGNENSLGHERVLTAGDIDLWKNKTRLPLFITATCEFSRFDDISINTATGEITGRNSAGEKILFRKDGGGIALMSTTRLVYSAPNYILNRNIFDAAFDRDPDGKALRMGDIIRIAKNRTESGINKRNFVLLGDPAVRLSYPWHGKIVTDSINNTPVNQPVDTLKALSVVTVKGHAEDLNGNLIGDFDGLVQPVIFDKPESIETFGNDGGQKVKFNLQNNILFSGKTIAADGKFSFTFIVPRDIDYTYGNARISYYASDGVIDFNGVFKDVVAGGFSNNYSSDTTGPVINLYFNDTLFRDGGLTDRNPELYAVIEDQNGINITGRGLGHDLICWLDDDRDNYLVLNNFFENEFGSTAKGKVIYRFSGLEPGSHTLVLKAWDNFNNSSEKSIRFIVGSGEDFTIKNLMNYPNPFSSSTRISAEHNRPEGVFEVTISIFSINGQLIRTINTVLASSGYQLPPVVWDGCNSGGRKVGKGIYPYRLKVTDDNGETVTISGRMIIL